MKKGLYKLKYGYSQHTLLFVTTELEVSNLVDRYEVITLETAKHQPEHVNTSEITLISTDTSVINHIIALGLNDIGRIESYFEVEQPEEITPLEEPTKQKSNETSKSVHGLTLEQMKLLFQEVEEKFKLKIDLSINELYFSGKGFKKLYGQKRVAIREFEDYDHEPYENCTKSVYCVNIHEDDPFNTINWENSDEREQMFIDIFNQCAEKITMRCRLLESERLGDFSFVFFPIMED